MLITKEKFRKICIKRLQNCNNNLVTNKVITKKLEHFLKITGYKNILVYNPLRFEVNIRGLVKKIRANKINIFLPKMAKNGLEIVPYRLPFVKKKFGVLEAKRSDFYKTKLDLIIVPTIGIDISFRRIGFGKGFYDKFYASLKYKPKVLFIQKTLCFCNQKITSLYDIKADYILTREGMIWI